MSISVGQARSLCATLLTGAGLPADRAEQVTHALVTAEAWGIGSHGLMRLPHYLDRMRAGGHPPGAELVTRRDTGPLVSMDGGGGLGHCQLTDAADLAGERARQFGIAAVSVGNSGHCGALGYYAQRLALSGLVAVVVSNGPAVMPAWQAATPLLSTSPIAAGIPLQPRPAVVDLALSTVARGKIAVKAKSGEPLPAGWALDRDGRPTEDAATALQGMLAPLGGAKGFALAFMVESLTGGIVGPALSTDVADMFDPASDATPQRIAHLVIALDPQLTSAAEEGETDVDARGRLTQLATRVSRSGGRVPGIGRTPPGEIDEDAPLNVDAATLADLQARIGDIAVR